MNLKNNTHPENQGCASYIKTQISPPKFDNNGKFSEIYSVGACPYDTKGTFQTKMRFIMTIWHETAYVPPRHHSARKWLNRRFALAIYAARKRAFYGVVHFGAVRPVSIRPIPIVKTAKSASSQMYGSERSSVQAMTPIRIASVSERLLSESRCF